jgi:4-carboxymuconolactone decarboxylase
VTANRRLGPLTTDQLDDDQIAVFEAIASGPRSRGKQAQSLIDPDGALVGPFNAMLLSGPVGMAVQGLGSALRFGTALSDRERELAILLVAADWRSAFNTDDASYAAAVEVLGERCVYELVTIVGHYSTLALHLRVFNGESPGATTPRR